MAVRYSSREVRFWEKVDKSGKCWLWTGCVAHFGYGQFNWSGSRPTVTVAAHIAAWRLSGNPEPASGQVLMHSCDNPRCVNPSHLVVGTRADNSRDMVKKRRSASGARHSQAVLTDDVVMEFRRRVANGEHIKTTAASLGIHPNNTSAALYINWRHLPPFRRLVRGHTRPK